MNWTGGSLQRTKHANKGVVQKQKAYFARSRTQLQNGLRSPVAPFRPSYLRKDDDHESGERIRSFHPGSTRHTSHTTRQRHGGTGRGTSPLDRTRCHEDEVGHAYQVASNGVSRHTILGLGSSGSAVREKPDQKRKADDANIEAQLLEANKKRLLRQQDWVGIAPSKPADLRYRPSKETDRIGKRRKIHGRHRASARRRSNMELADQLLQPTNDDYAYMSGALPIDAAEIRIRVGTDALTTAYSTQPDDCVQSQTSSDPMLFEQASSDFMLLDPEVPDATRRKEPHDLKPATLEPCTSIEEFRPIDNHEHQLANEHTQPFDGDMRRALQEPGAKGRSDSDPAQLAYVGHYALAVESKDRESEASAPDFQITHSVAGVRRPLRLLFGEPSSSKGPHDCTTSQHDGIGEGKHALEADTVGLSKTGHMDQASSNNMPQIVDKTLTIGDEEPWKPYIAFPDESSSYSTAAQDLETSLMHSYSTARNNEAEFVDWSQHATQGNYTHVHSMSASSPSFMRPSEKLPVCPASPRNIDKDDRIWQNFVFGSDEDSELETISDCNGVSEQRTLKVFRGSSHLSLSVSSTSTPFRAGLGMVSCISDNLQDVANYPPLPGSPSIAPRFDGFVEEFHHGEQGNDTTSGEQSVTHASLQNNASFNTDSISPMMFSDATTSRSSQNQFGRISDGYSGRATAGNSELGRIQQSSMAYEMPFSSDNALHLIDPDSLV
ncbi:hypothetical protein P153DRAFT_296958 [Dothidotthia symphoricarpi CBS 119687]|uniref:Uncharacterized protein n=1 Tax=Dothidotthia symphoricarpi CBS 119687 TaxID=1392245 RepID=A0A6A6A6U0_9PLEO|nr:uncharacterized protein P153DRAFT_296958 [Dothidotthia symphoricarpi CBS 119687]KAF2126915.1 hypothetical protein P153DRAFT_296958 [Dothidotthia symphoricarpi CBS 119687]